LHIAYGPPYERADIVHRACDSARWKHMKRLKGASI
jgi:hypothetical protein